MYTKSSNPYQQELPLYQFRELVLKEKVLVPVSCTRINILFFKNLTLNITSKHKVFSFLAIKGYNKSDFSNIYYQGIWHFSS